MYAVALLHAARQAIIELDRAQQKQVAASLRGELWCRTGNSPLTVRLKKSELPGLDPDPPHRYFLASLSAGYWAVFRCMTTRELDDPGNNPDRLKAGRMVYNLLP